MRTELGHCALVRHVDFPAQLGDAGFAVGEEVCDDADCLSIVDHAETRVKSSVMNDDDVAENGHEGKEVFEETCAGDNGWWAQDAWWEVFGRNCVEGLPDRL